MLTLPTFTLPSYSLASSSRIGAIILQGPHHSAQKSTRTGVVDFKTSSSKLAAVRVTILFADMRQEGNSNGSECGRLLKLQHKNADEDEHGNKRGCKGQRLIQSTN